MNVHESHCLCRILEALLDPDPAPALWFEARASAQVLARRAHERLAAGISGADVERRWGRDEPPPACRLRPEAAP